MLYPHSTMKMSGRIPSLPSRPSKKKGSVPRLPAMNNALSEENTGSLPQNLTSSMNLLSTVDPSYSPPKENLFVDTSSPTAGDGPKEESFSISSLSSHKRRRGTPSSNYLSRCKDNEAASRAGVSLFSKGMSEELADDEASEDVQDEEQWTNVLQLSPSKRTKRYWEICYGNATSKSIDKSFSANRAPPSKGWCVHRLFLV